MDWSLDKTALKTGVSKAMLGQIERGESSPTISTLWKIAAGFRVPLSKLLEKSPSKKALSVQLGTTEHWNSSTGGLEINSIFPFDPDLGCEFFILKLPPAYQHVSPPHEAGVVEHIIVVEGTLDVLLDRAWTPIYAGRGIRFEADIEHGYRNSTSEVVSFHNTIHYPSTEKRIESKRI